MTLPSHVWLLFPLISGVIAFAVLWALGIRAGSRDTAKDRHIPGATDGFAHFLLRDGKLADHDQAAGLLPHGLSDWAGLRDWFAFRFPEFPKSPSELDEGQSLQLAAIHPGDLAELRLNRNGDLCRIVLHDPATPDAGERHERLRLATYMQNLDVAFRHAPFGLSMTRNDGTTVWENRAFAKLPAPERSSLLPDPATVKPGQDPVTNRRSLPAPDGGDELWFDISTVRIADDLFHYTNDVSKVIRAETVRREFVQTLTKTFANLTTGLAVFDREKRLALFNPALIDLTGLGAEFLSARPTLVSVFDTLRDRQVMPEPKDYTNWRKELGKMVASASDGFFEDTWALPWGLTYRVTGRPHPDGAIAFLFEDISEEVSLTRRFRAQLDLRQSVLDHLSEAVAVLSPDNMLLLCNTRFSDLLDLGPDDRLVEVPAAGLIDTCASLWPDTAFWSEARKRLAAHALRTPLDAVLERPSGGRMRCRFTPLSGGSTMLSLAPLQKDRSAIRKAAV